jgi:hypothetical protein
MSLDTEAVGTFEVGQEFQNTTPLNARELYHTIPFPFLVLM